MDFSEKHTNWEAVLEDLKNQQPLDEMVQLEKALLVKEDELDGHDYFELRSHRIESRTVKELIRGAREARELSYAPYSHFNVGCAALAENTTGDRKMFKGCNVENASYGATLCAERTSVPSAVSNGYRKVLAYAVVGGFDYSMSDELRKAADEDFITPCGNCRQVTKEFEADPCFVIMAKDKGEVMITQMEYILPLGFGPKSLGADVNQYSRNTVKEERS